MDRKQIAARRLQISTRLAAIAALVATEQRTLTDAEVAETNTLEQEDTGLASTDRFLARIEERELAAQAAAAQPPQVRGVPVAAPAVLTRTTQAQRNGDKFKGQSFARYVLALAAARLRNTSVENVMADRFGQTRPELVRLAKIWNAKGVAGVLEQAAQRIQASDIAGGGTGSGDWGHELVQADGQYAGDFIDLLRAKTVFDQLPLTVVPANVTIKGQDGTGTAYFVGEHKAIPMSAQDYSAVTLTPLKIGALTALSIELVEDSTPDAEQLATNSLVKDCAQLLDSRFFSTTAASAGVSPAGMLNGVSAVGASAGTGLNGLITDTEALIQAFITAKNTGGLHWVSLPGVARKIADFRNLMGQRVFDTLTEEGGTYDGKPYHTTDNAGAGDLILMKPSDVYKIGDQGLSVDVSTEATLEFGNAPTGAGDTPTDMSENPVSLFQAGMIGIRVMRRINWAKRRSGAVQFIDDTAYVPQIQTA
jgi:HK97 family phage major capsid protein